MTVYKLLGKFVSYEDKVFGDVAKYIISYTQPNYQDPKRVWKHNAIEADLSDRAIDKLVSLKEGDEFCAHQTKDDKGYPVIVDITDAKDAEKKQEATKKEWNKGGGNKQWQPKDETGIAVGAAWTNAIEFLKLVGLKTATTDDVDKLAWDILQRKLAHEARLRASKKEAIPDSKVENKEEEKEPLSRAEQAKARKAQEKEPEPNLVDNDLDDVQFD